MEAVSDCVTEPVDVVEEVLVSVAEPVDEIEAVTVRVTEPVDVADGVRVCVMLLVADVVPLQVVLRVAVGVCVCDGVGRMTPLRAIWVEFGQGEG